MHFSGEPDLQGLKVRQRLKYLSKKSKNKIMHMLRKYTSCTQVTRQLKEMYHICIIILEGAGACMEVFTQAISKQNSALVKISNTSDL